jgi:hypothetical protein
MLVAASAGTAFGLAGLVAFPPTAEAATISVPCSTSTLQSDINGASPGDTLDLAAGCTYTVSSPYTLDDGLPPITTSNSPLTIVGNGATITASATGFRFFLVDAGATLTVRHLMLTNASLSNVGAAITNDGTTVVSNSTFSGNSVTGFDDGGAIDTQGTLSVSASTFFDNHANNSLGGGAIAIGPTPGTVAISNSTFFNNTATGGSGGGGAIEVEFPSPATVSILNSTMSGNSAHIDGTVYNGGNATTVTNTIVDATGSTGGGTCGGSAVPPVIDGGNNLEYNGGSPTTCGFSTHAVSAAPKLGPLQDNGGLAGTMALLPGSPAISAGSNTVCAAAAPPPPSNTGAGGVDQRGVPRPQGTQCDIGAFEVVATVSALSAPSTATASTSVTLVCTVTPVVAIPGQPAGTVAFYDGSTLLGSAGLTGASPDTATLVASSGLSTGTHSLTCTYQQTFDFLTSTSGATTSTISAGAAAVVSVPSTGVGQTLPAGALLIAAGTALAVASRRRRRR